MGRALNLNEEMCGCCVCPGRNKTMHMNKLSFVSQTTKQGKRVRIWVW